MRLSVLIISLLFMAHSQNINAQSLNDFQWKNRILLLVDVDSDTKELKSQLNEFVSDKNALKERDLIILQVTPDAVYSSDGSPSKLKASSIYDKFDLSSDFSGIVLIGKDGGAKLKKPFEVSVQAIFDLIDGMPMRRAEMRESGRHEG